MATCPSGHESASDDFCDVCGILIGAPAAFAAAPDGSAPGTAPYPAASGGTPATPPSAETCPRCTTPRTGQFCEACRLRLHHPRPSHPPSPIARAHRAAILRHARTPRHARAPRPLSNLAVRPPPPQPRRSRVSGRRW